MKQKFTKYLITLALILAPTLVFANQSNPDRNANPGNPLAPEGVIWTFDVNPDGKTATITGTYPSSTTNISGDEVLSGAVTFPPSVTDNTGTYTVTGIVGGNNKRNGIQSNLNITRLSLPPTLTNIGDYAFYFCTGLTGDLNLSGLTSLTNIGSYAFYYCWRLTGDLNLSGLTSLTNIGNYAFSDCLGLTGDLNLSGCASLKTIEDHAFYTCLNLTGDLNLSGCTNLMIIGNYAFSDCQGLTGNLDLSGCTSLTTIGDNAFAGCSGLTNDLDLSGLTSLKTIGNYAFAGCPGFTGNLNLSGLANLTTIGSDAFENCSGLTGDVVIPEGVYSLMGGTFYYCPNLNSITYLSTTLDFSNSFAEFYGCTNLTKIYFSAATSSVGLKSLARTIVSGANNDAVFWGLPSSTVVYMPQDLQPNTTSILKYNVVDDVNYVWATTDGIKGINDNEGGNAERSIYTLDGRYVGTDMNVLVNGVYIVNGKKVIK